MLEIKNIIGKARENAKYLKMIELILEIILKIKLLEGKGLR